MDFHTKVDSSSTTGSVVIEENTKNNVPSGTNHSVLPHISPDHSGSLHTSPPYHTSDHTGSLHTSLPDHTGLHHTGPPDHTGPFHTGPPDHNGSLHTSPPDHAGSLHTSSPDHTHTGPPDHTSPPYHTPDHTGSLHTSPPEHTGPLHTGHPEHKGPIDHTGLHHTGPLDHTGSLNHNGPLELKDPLEHTGHTGHLNHNGPLEHTGHTGPLNHNGPLEHTGHLEHSGHPEHNQVPPDSPVIVYPLVLSGSTLNNIPSGGPTDTNGSGGPSNVPEITVPLIVSAVGPTNIDNPGDVPSNVPEITVPMIVPSVDPTNIENPGDVPSKVPEIFVQMNDPPPKSKKIDLTMDGGIVKEILRESPNGGSVPNYRTFPTNDAKCHFHVTITGEGGFPVYKDTKGSKPLEAFLGNEELPVELEFSLCSMKIGELAHFQVKAEKNEGYKPFDVPQKSHIEYTIDLIHFENPPDLGSIASYEDRYTAALQMKNSGNTFFTKNKLDQAIRKYNAALRIIQQDTIMNTQPVRKEILLPCFLNLAASYLNQKQHQEAIMNASKALEIDSHNVKGHWRRGIALMETGEWIDAEKDFLAALEQADKASKKKILVTYNDLKKRISEQDRKDKENYQKIFYEDKKPFYEDLYKQIESLISSEQNLLANMANTASVIHEELNKKKNNKINWTGFYLLHSNGDLVLGPFQGKIACNRIGPGKGVCGTAVQKKETMLVNDVHNFKGHIACDSDSVSEIVIPIIWKESVVGVLDIDSLVINGFDEQDKTGLEKIVSLLVEKCKWDQLVSMTHPQKRLKAVPQSRNYLWKIVGGGLLTVVGLVAISFFKSLKFFVRGEKNPLLLK